MIFPMSHRAARLLGGQAERIENPSLLQDKFVLPKEFLDYPGKINQAGHWSFGRIVKGGQDFLQRQAKAQARDAEKLRRRADRPNERNPDDCLRRARTAEASVAALRDMARTKTLFNPATGTAWAGARQEFLRKLAAAPGTATLRARLKARLAVNLSEGLIQNGGICLDRISGQPFLPGSAVKGNARHAALAEIGGISDSPARLAALRRFIQVFGCCENDFKTGNNGSNLLAAHAADLGGPHDAKGRVTFLPAYPVGDAVLEMDLTNVHYPDYYTARGRAGAESLLRTERPAPNPFPAVAAGAEFGFGLALNPLGMAGEEGASILEHALEWLTAALTQHGVGAKTGAGYGWFEIVPSTPEPGGVKPAEIPSNATPASPAQIRPASDSPAEEMPPPLNPEEQTRAAFLALPEDAQAQRITQLPALPETEARAILSALGTRAFKSRVASWKKRQDKRPNDRKRLEAIREAAAKWNLPDPTA